MNLLSIAISVVVIVIWELNIDLPCIDGGMKEDAAFLKFLTEKIDSIFKIIKLVPCIVALVYLSFVQDFYNEIAERGCSDPTTNMNFNAVGQTLPSSFIFCLMTLIMDMLHFAAPYIRKLYLHCRSQRARKVAAAEAVSTQEV